MTLSPTAVLRMAAVNAVAAAWAILILLAFIGVGSVFRRFLQYDRLSGTPVDAAIGMVGFLMIGGYLNTFGWIRPATHFVLIAVGFVCFLTTRHSHGQWVRETWTWLADTSKINKLAVGLLLCVIACQLIGWISPPFWKFHPSDDYHAYLAQVERMIETGSLGNDPFCERRLSSLGGQVFLLSIMRAGGALRNLRVVDSGLAYVVFGGLMVIMSRGSGLRPRGVISILFVAIMLPVLSINLTSCFTTAALFLLACLIALKCELSESEWALNDWVLLGLTAGAVISLKSTVVVVVGLFLFACLVTSMRRHGRFTRLFIPSLILLGCILLVTGPWMQAMMASSGTWLYPLLGKGFHASAYGMIPHRPWDQFVWRDIMNAGAYSRGILWVVVLPLAACVIKMRPEEQRVFLMCAVPGAISCLITVYVFQGALHPYRFAVAYSLVPLVVASIATVRQIGPRRFNLSWAGVLISLVVLRAVFAFPDSLKNAYQLIRVQVRQGDLVRLIPPRIAEGYSSAQRAIPPGFSVLVHGEHNFGFDFRRNPILICDFPAGSSPPPGMPLFRGPEPLAGYLTNPGIRFVLYSYRNFAGFSIPGEGGYVRPETRALGHWIKSEIDMTFDYQDNLILLSRTRRKAFDDGNVFVLDLTQPPDLPSDGGPLRPTNSPAPPTN